MCLAQGPQCSDAGEARTRSPSVSSQAFYHRVTALPFQILLTGKEQYYSNHLKNAVLFKVHNSLHVPLKCRIHFPIFFASFKRNQKKAQYFV